ncbi:hypothetical protein E2C01_015096 [Portunus trituberculatus]|uniref:Uncharacterized protein n=1 Tax=Portunus trituberculatus TaxID=210409 RepID=A0A5B7DLX3_PORTR|nr:hypothetical protein [Portunus trituberculatus]
MPSRLLASRQPAVPPRKHKDLSDRSLGRTETIPKSHIGTVSTNGNSNNSSSGSSSRRSSSR